MMRRNNRTKYLLALVALVLFITLYYSSDAGPTKNGDFYKKTATALEKAAEDKRIKAGADAELQDIIKHAKHLGGEETVAKADPVLAAEDAKKKLPPPPGAEEPVEEQSVAGRKMMPKPKWDTGKEEEEALNGGRLAEIDPGLAEAKEELNTILRRSPIIIFSKTFCPFSRKAKALLLDTYNITPAPFVVELDTLTNPIANLGSVPPITLGRKLQDLLAESTGRKTVPNILINGRSIGGSDELAQLDRDDKLLGKIRDMGGRWIHEAERRGASAALPDGKKL